jgi:hypothetical protein
MFIFLDSVITTFFIQIIRPPIFGIFFSLFIVIYRDFIIIMKRTNQEFGNELERVTKIVLLAIIVAQFIISGISFF